jgi:bud site selection protein 31
MPKIRTTRTKKPPEGFEDIEQARTVLLHLSNDSSTDAVQPVFCSGACSTLQILDDYAKKMRDAENETHEGKRKAESLWPIMRLSHTRSRYIYELYYKRDAISKELYDWLLKEGYADAKYVAVLGHS